MRVKRNAANAVDANATSVSSDTTPAQRSAVAAASRTEGGAEEQLAHHHHHRVHRVAQEHRLTQENRTEGNGDGAVPAPEQPLLVHLPGDEGVRTVDDEDEQGRRHDGHAVRDHPRRDDCEVESGIHRASSVWLKPTTQAIPASRKPRALRPVVV